MGITPANNRLTEIKQRYNQPWPRHDKAYIADDDYQCGQLSLEDAARISDDAEGSGNAK